MWEHINQVCSCFGLVFDDEEHERHRRLRGERPGGEERKSIIGEKSTVELTTERFHIT